MTAECPICYEVFSADLRLASLRCGHVCCAECLDTWLGNSDEYTCPICRYNPEDDAEDPFDTSGCRPVYLKFGEGSHSQTSSPIRSSASKSRPDVNVPGLARRIDGVQRRVDNLTSQAVFPDVAELRVVVSGIQLLGDGVRTNLVSEEVQALGRHLQQQITHLTSYLDARYSLTLVELDAARTAKTRLTADLKVVSARQREKERLIREQSNEMARMSTQIEKSVRENEEARRKAIEHLDLTVKALEAENLQLKRREAERNTKVADMLKADAEMKNTVLQLKKKLAVRDKESSDLQRQLENQKGELARMSEDNAGLKRKPKAASSSDSPHVPTRRLTAKNLAAHTASHAITIGDPDDEPLLIESSPKLLERKAPPVESLLLDRSMFQPESASRMPPNPFSQNLPKPNVPGKRKVEIDPLAFLRTSTSLATGPKRSRRLP